MIFSSACLIGNVFVWGIPCSSRKVESQTDKPLMGLFTWEEWALALTSARSKCENGPLWGGDLIGVQSKSWSHAYPQESGAACMVSRSLDSTLTASDAQEEGLWGKPAPMKDYGLFLAKRLCCKESIEKKSSPKGEWSVQCLSSAFSPERTVVKSLSSAVRLSSNPTSESQLTVWI